MKHLVLVFVGVLLIVEGAAAGTIEGTVAAESTGKRGFVLTQPGVVWLNGARKFSSPTEVRTLAQHGGQFVPPFLIVVAGQTVQMLNEDSVVHGAYSESSAKTFNLGYYAKGMPKSVTFDRPGLVEVCCPIHSAMRSTILVVPTPYYASVAADGSFRINNVPAGKYTLNFWSELQPLLSKEIWVPPSGRVFVHVENAEQRSGPLK